MRRPPVDKPLLSTPNTRPQFYVDSANVNESVARENISGDGVNTVVVDEPQDQVTAEKNVENGKRDDGSDRDYFGSMVSINEHFSPDPDATPKKTEWEIDERTNEQINNGLRHFHQTSFHCNSIVFSFVLSRLLIVSIRPLFVVRVFGVGIVVHSIPMSPHHISSAKFTQLWAVVCG